MKRSAEAYALNIRGYIDTLSDSLKCSMDVQSTNGKAMLLKYVTSYVSKWKDGVGREGLFEKNVTGSQAAFKFVVESHPGAPQMAMTLNSTKVAWSNSATKKFVPLKFRQVYTPDEIPIEIQLYMQRTPDEDATNLSDFLRQ